MFGTHAIAVGGIRRDEPSEPALQETAQPLVLHDEGRHHDHHDGRREEDSEAQADRRGDQELSLHAPLEDEWRDAQQDD